MWRAILISERKPAQQNNGSSHPPLLQNLLLNAWQARLRKKCGFYAHSTRVLSRRHIQLSSLTVTIRVPFVRTNDHRGKGAAIRTGIKVATGAVIVIPHAECKYDPGDFQYLLQPIVAGEADIVYGTRYSHYADNCHRCGISRSTPRSRSWQVWRSAFG